MSDRDYCYPPDYTVLRNRLDIRDAPALEAAERALVAQRLLEPVPAGDFDLDHLKAIHPPPVPGRLCVGGRGPHRRDRQGREPIPAAAVHRRRHGGRPPPHRGGGVFRGSGPDGFAEDAGPVLGDVNHVHPFREGNGRTQLQYLKQLAARAGHAIDLTRLDRAAWLDASRRSNTGDHEAITRCIRRALV